ncbi:nicotinamide-nucleotide adenylyltransferase, NadR type [Marivirga sericea]|uniref:Nicotinamide-nucleotide adenylyltransferase, NadR type n=1 Tax=Marivirga sericea TaxID=1028 RepID=A0A1X7JZU0_9BACT|nr:ATP-binding protein [Marivirga sericea]SMG34107.1 nicotinamide-nucleotide adenylyltransferase, NadR type [Marivirga sericea]
MKKIAVIGPESTGKSTLTKDLAHYFNEPFVAEYGRTYLEENGSFYVESDLLNISKGMLEIEQTQAKNANRFLFCDTDLIMMKVWYEVKYGTCHPWVLGQLRSNPYDFHLLCAPDLPWEADPLRENPTTRVELFEHYQNELIDYQCAYSVISGTNDRLQKAIEVLEKI